MSGRQGATHATPRERILRSVTVDDSGCWLWQLYINQGGYAQMRVNGSGARAHRVAYEIWNGPIPDGLVLDHLCRVRHCVNPQHLEAVTLAENTLRGEARSVGAWNAIKTHCVNGHEFTPENTYRRASDPRRRDCNQCICARRAKARSPISN